MLRWAVCWTKLIRACIQSHHTDPLKLTMVAVFTLWEFTNAINQDVTNRRLGPGGERLLINIYQYTTVIIFSVSSFLDLRASISSITEIFQLGISWRTQFDERSFSHFMFFCF